MQSLASQSYAFVITMLMGLTIGLLFDFYKFSKGIIRPGKIFGFIADLSFWVISTLTVFFLLLIGNWGEIRFYVVLGAVIGAAVYFKFLSYGVLRVFGGIFYYLKRSVLFCVRIIGILWTAIIYPFVLVRNIVIIPVGYLSAALAGARRAAARLANRSLAGPLSRAGRSVKSRYKRWWESLFKKT